VTTDPPEEPAGQPHDPYQYGFDVAQRRRIPLPEIPEEGQRRRRPPRDTWKWVLGGLAVVTGVAIGRGVAARNATALSADCHRFQVAVGEKSVVSHSSHLLHWAVTGPAGTSYVVALNARSLSVSGDVANAVPGVGSAGQASRVQKLGHGCLATGVFGVLLPPGRYDVTLFQVDVVTAIPVAHTSVTVTAS
jgi:hypothetical protein